MLITSLLVNIGSRRNVNMCIDVVLKRRRYIMYVNVAEIGARVRIECFNFNPVLLNRMHNGNELVSWALKLVNKSIIYINIFLKHLCIQINQHSIKSFTMQSEKTVICQVPI